MAGGSRVFPPARVDPAWGRSGVGGGSGRQRVRAPRRSVRAGPDARPRAPARARSPARMFRARAPGSAPGGERPARPGAGRARARKTPRVPGPPSPGRARGGRRQHLAPRRRLRSRVAADTTAHGPKAAPAAAEGPRPRGPRARGCGRARLPRADVALQRGRVGVASGGPQGSGVGTWRCETREALGAGEEPPRRLAGAPATSGRAGRRLREKPGRRVVPRGHEGGPRGCRAESGRPSGGPAGLFRSVAGRRGQLGKGKGTVFCPRRATAAGPCVPGDPAVVGVASGATGHLGHVHGCRRRLAASGRGLARLRRVGRVCAPRTPAQAQVWGERRWVGRPRAHGPGESSALGASGASLFQREGPGGVRLPPVPAGLARGSLGTERPPCGPAWRVSLMRHTWR